MIGKILSLITIIGSVFSAPPIDPYSQSNDMVDLICVNDFINNFALTNYGLDLSDGYIYYVDPNFDFYNGFMCSGSNLELGWVDRNGLTTIGKRYLSFTNCALELLNLNNAINDGISNCGYSSKLTPLTSDTKPTPIGIGNSCINQYINDWLISAKLIRSPLPIVYNWLDTTDPNFREFTCNYIIPSDFYDFTELVNNMNGFREDWLSYDLCKMEFHSCPVEMSCRYSFSIAMWLEKSI